MNNPVSPRPDPRMIVEMTLLEGPAADRDGTLVFSDVIGNRLCRMEPAASGAVTVVRAPAGRANGNAFDTEGRLVTCEGAEHGPGGGRRVVRQVLDSHEVEILADSFDGAKLNSPNDLAIDDEGRIFFTDPRYGDRAGMESDVEGVYRIDPDGTLHRILGQPELERPNGVAIRPDGRELYVVDSSYDRPTGARRVWAFPLDAEGVPTDRRLLYDFGRGRGGDGIEVDASGVLYVCAGVAQPRSPNETADVVPGVYRITADGRLIDVLPVGTDVITNCCFGGPDMRTLFVTAGHRVYATRVQVPGWHAWRWTQGYPGRPPVPG